MKDGEKDLVAHLVEQDRIETTPRAAEGGKRVMPEIALQSVAASRADRLNPQEGAELLEMLKVIVVRAATDGRAVKRAAEAAGGLAEPAAGTGMPFGAMPETAGL